MQEAVRLDAFLMTGFVLIAALFSCTTAESITSAIIYADKQCTGTPLVVSVIESVSCTSEECSSFTATDGTTYYTSTTCANTNRETYVDEAFDGSSYLLIEMYTNKCGLFMAANAFLATGECHIYSTSGGNSVLTTLNEDGSATAYIYNGTACSGTPIISYEPDSDSVSSHSCFKNYSVFYASTESSNAGSSSLSDVSSSTTTSTSLSITDSSVTVSTSSHASNAVSSTNRTAVADDSTSIDSSDDGVVRTAASGSTDDDEANGSQSNDNSTVSIEPSGSSGVLAPTLSSASSSPTSYFVLPRAYCAWIKCRDSPADFVARDVSCSLSTRSTRPPKDQARSKRSLAPTRSSTTTTSLFRCI